jgi:hypothetical protein
LDLRKFIKDKTHVETARQLAIRGLLNYQPWIFSDDFETGVGLEWSEGQFSGLVYYPDIDRSLLEGSPELRRLIIDPARYKEFHEANVKLRQLYDGIVDAICKKVGDVRQLSFLDVGCNTGYLPQSFALLGAREAAGCDREGYFAETFDLLNAVLGTKARFYKSFYNPLSREIEGIREHDVVLSMAVLCHLSDPLTHIKCLGNIAGKALFVWTLVNEDEGYSIRFGEPQGHYKQDSFPLCFDNEITISEKLLQRSLELLGFRHVFEIPARDSSLPSFGWRGCSLRGFLGIRA